MPRHYAMTMMVAGAALAGAVVGCSGQPALTGASANACFQFAVSAIERHVTVTAVPPACQGLSQIEVNATVGRALRAAAAGVRGKVRQRELIARDSPYVAALIHPVPASSPPAVTARPSGPPSRAALSLAALAAWLVTVALGVSMMARWITRTRRHGTPHRGRGPVLNFTHLGLALTGLLTWIGYLVTGVTGLAWAACGLLLAGRPAWAWPWCSSPGQRGSRDPARGRPAAHRPSARPGHRGAHHSGLRHNPARRHRLSHRCGRRSLVSLAAAGIGSSGFSHEGADSEDGTRDLAAGFRSRLIAVAIASMVRIP